MLSPCFYTMPEPDSVFDPGAPAKERRRVVPQIEGHGSNSVGHIDSNVEPDERRRCTMETENEGSISSQRSCAGRQVEAWLSMTYKDIYVI